MGNHKMGLKKIENLEYLPSILAADPLNIKAGIEKVIQNGLQQVHIDVMDGHFVPNICLGPAVTQSIHQAYPNLFLDVHLMIERPDLFLDTFLKAGADRIFIHIEIDPVVLLTTLKQLENSSCKVGLALNPETPVERIIPYLNQFNVDRVLVMSVHPGFSGQSFIPSALPKLRFLTDAFPHLTYCMDGGINEETAQQCFDRGARACVVGACFFS